MSIWNFTISFILLSNLYSVSAGCDEDTVNQTKWTKDDFPNPQVDITECGRCNKTSWICDPNRVLSQDQADMLDGIINGIRQNGKCVCTDCKNKHGVTIAIAVVDGMMNPGATDEKIETTAKEFVKFLRETKWKFGICNDDIAVLLSRTDRKIFTNVGKAVGNILTNECLEYTYLNVKSMLSLGFYSMALQQMLDSYKTSVDIGVCSVKPPTTKKTTTTPYYGWIGFVVIGALFLIGVSVLGCKFLSNTDCDCDCDCDFCIQCFSSSCCDRSETYRDTRPTVVMRSTHATSGRTAKTDLDIKYGADRNKRSGSTTVAHHNNGTGTTRTSYSHDSGTATTSNDVHMDFSFDSGGGGGGDSSGFDGGGGF